MDDTDQRRIDAGNDIDLKWLRSFVVVAEEASFTRAASRVHVAQPGVSAQVRRLESELGQQLLDRSGRSVRLTEVGSAVLPFARAALDAVANARLAVDELAGLVRGQVTVGMVSGCALPVLAELLAGFHDRLPGRGHHPGRGQLRPPGRAAQGRPARPRPDRLGGADRRRTSTPWSSWTRNWSRRCPPATRSPTPAAHGRQAARPAAGQPAPRHRRAGGARRRLRRGRVHPADRVRGQRPAHGGPAGRPGPGTRRSPGFDTERAEDSAHHRPAAPLSPGARLAPRPLGQPCRPGPYRAGASARTTRAASVLSS